MRWKIKTKPITGDTRRKRKFAFLPTQIEVLTYSRSGEEPLCDDIIVWLEFYSSRQLFGYDIYRGVYCWKEIRRTVTELRSLRSA